MPQLTKECADIQIIDIKDFLKLETQVNTLEKKVDNFEKELIPTVKRLEKVIADARVVAVTLKWCATVVATFVTVVIPLVMYIKHYFFGGSL